MYETMLHPFRVTVRSSPGSKTSALLIRPAVWRVLFVAFLCLSDVRVCSTFNLEVKYPFDFVLQPDTPSRDISPERMHFGYAIDFHAEDSVTDIKRLLVGAPRSNNIYQRGLVQPGAVFNCTLGAQSRGTACTTMAVDRTGNVVDADPTQNKSAQDFGISLDSRSTETGYQIVIGAPKLKTMYKGHKSVRSFSTGSCFSSQYIRGNDRNSYDWKTLTRMENETEMTPTFKPSPNEVYKQAFALRGIHTHITQLGYTMIGTPGLFDFYGGLLIIRNSSMDHCAFTLPNTKKKKVPTATLR